MRSPRWTKMRRDLWLASGRTAMMVIAIAVSLIGVGGVLSTYSIMTREISRNYLDTNPAVATLTIDRVDPALLSAIRARPGIADATARATIMARAQVTGVGWRPLLLFVVDDFTAMRISTVRSEEGAWPPPAGTMLVERTALQMLSTQVGGQVVVKTPHGNPQSIAVSGVVHDPGLAPAWQEREGYGYITPATLALLGENDQLDEVKITLNPASYDQNTVEASARDLAGWLQTQGHPVSEIQVPPPGRHPHQSQMMGVLFLLLSFSLLSLVLSAILVATMVNQLLAQQIRQIGVMKAVGATNRQILVLYLGMVLGVSAVALVLALPVGMFVGQGFSGVMAQLLNLDRGSLDIPAWVVAVQVGAGLLIPLTVALVPIRRGSRITVREAIADYGVPAQNLGRGIERILATLPWLSRGLLFTLRNTFRRRGRLLLTLSLLAAGGALFITGLNIANAWQQNLADGLAARRYDVEVRLSEPTSAGPLLAQVRTVPGVLAVEAWGYAPTSVARAGVADVEHTYPDGGHGSFSLRGAPAGTKLVQFPLLSGRWLEPDDADAVVLNQMALVQLPEVKVGDRINLALDGRPVTWRVVGIVREIGSPAAAYVTDEAFTRASGQPGLTRSIRVVASGSDPATRQAVAQALINKLDASGVGIALVLTDAELRSAMGDHILVLIAALIGMAALMGIVGVLGLAAAMSTSVVERTREFGVLQTIGGRPGLIIRMVVGEGVFIGLLSWVGAVILSLPLSALVGQIVGDMSFRTPLPLIVDGGALGLWAAILVMGAAVASAYPALRASRLTIRETLAYV